jgi:hypothetical protein
VREYSFLSLLKCCQGWSSCGLPLCLDPWNPNLASVSQSHNGAYGQHFLYLHTKGSCHKAGARTGGEFPILWLFSTCGFQRLPLAHLWSGTYANRICRIGSQFAPAASCTFPIGISQYDCLFAWQIIFLECPGTLGHRIRSKLIYLECLAFLLTKLRWRFHSYSPYYSSLRTARSAPFL